MPTPADLRSRRNALSAQRSSSVARVSYDGKTVEYLSVAEIDRAIEALDREIAAAEGRRIVRQVRVTTAKASRPRGFSRSSARCRTRQPSICGSTRPAGSVFDAVAIHNALSRHAGPVTVWIDGIAASAASYIAMAGDEIVMPENAFLMIHDPGRRVFARR